MAQTEFSTCTIAAYFENSSDARKAVDALQKAGFTSAHLGIAHHGSYTGESSTFGNTTVYETEDKEPSTWDKIKAWFSGNIAEVRSEERAPGDAASREFSERVDENDDGASDLRGSFTAMNIPRIELVTSRIVSRAVKMPLLSPSRPATGRLRRNRSSRNTTPIWAKAPRHTSMRWKTNCLLMIFAKRAAPTHPATCSCLAYCEYKRCA